MNKYQQSNANDTPNNLTKTSFISLHQNHQQKPQQRLAKYSSQVFDLVLSNNRLNPPKDLSAKFDKGNCDEESTKQFTKCEDHLSKDNHAVNFEQIMNQPKIGRESENILIGCQLKCSKSGKGERKIANSKSTSFLAPNSGCQMIEIETLNMLSPRQQDIDEIKDLQMKIKQVQAQNKKIKQENIKLRMIKLSTNSHTLQMASLRLQMQQLRKKILKVKLQANFFQDSSELKTQSKMKLKQNRVYECHDDNRPRGSQLDHRTYLNHPQQIFLSSFLQKPNQFCQSGSLPVNYGHLPVKCYPGIQVNQIPQVNRIRFHQNSEMEQSPYCCKK